jgi:excisionase family DNA binding protein
MTSNASLPHDGQTAEEQLLDEILGGDGQLTPKRVAALLLEVAAALLLDQEVSPRPEPAEQQAYCTVDQAAEITTLSRDALYDAMRRGQLRYIKHGQRRIITRKHLDEFMESALVRPPEITPHTVGRSRVTRLHR